MDKKRDSFFLPQKKPKEYHPGKWNEAKNKDKQGKRNGDTIKKRRQDNFNENREGLTSNDTRDKKPFDKKTYRLKKYSKKYKLEQWEEQRKKKLLRNYYKDVKPDETTGTYSAKIFDQDTTDSSDAGRFVRHPDLIEKEETNKQKKKDPFQKAKEHYNKIKQEKLDKKQEMQKEREERNQKLQEYKKKKQERFKKLSKKTKKGQPVMTGRLELLLEKLQKPQ